MQDGFTLLELMLTLGLIALLATFAFPHYADFMAKTTMDLEIEQLVRGITLARQQAILRGYAVSICPYEEDGNCGNDWSTGLMIIDTEKSLSQITFTQKARVFLKTFPTGHEYQLTFSGMGFTQTQNGSFYYCADQIPAAKRIVFNQAGRVYITQDEASQACGL